MFHSTLALCMGSGLSCQKSQELGLSGTPIALAVVGSFKQ